MNIRGATVFGFVWVLIWLAGCGGDDEGMACIPGVQQECACEGVYQECKEDGSGFTSCDCDGASESASSEESGDEASPEGGEAPGEEGGEAPGEEGGEVPTEEGGEAPAEEGGEASAE